MFKIKPITSCPHSRKSTGIVLMQPSLVAELAAAVTDKDEWAILLHGERRKDGYEVEVKDYSIPPQSRSGGHVSIAEFDLEADVVGVIHSHHSMGSFFSTIDTSTLNPRFPISIVVAHGATMYLGFDYKGTGKVQLPCGSTGEIEFRIQPTEGPVVAEIAQVTHDVANLGDCNKHVDHGDQFYVEFEAACGLKEPRALKAKAFGTEATLLDAVAKLDRPVIVGIGKQYSSGAQLTEKQIREDPDSKWCKEHKAWDWCEFKQRLSALPSSSVPADNEYWCYEHQDWDNCLIAKSSGGGESFLKKYEDIVERQSVSFGDTDYYCSNTKLPKSDCLCGVHKDHQTTSTEQLVYCDDCLMRAPFMNWSCENCGAPYCQTCEDGHTGPCPEQEGGLCRCGTVIQGDYTYCSQRCLEYFEPAVSETTRTVEVNGIKGEKMKDGCILIIP